MRRRLTIPAPHRRGFLTAAAGLLGATSLAGCDRFAGTDWGRRALRAGEDANMFVQRLALSPASLARTYPESEISTWFKPNGTVDPEDKPYKALAARNFETYRLRVDGLVEHPQDVSLKELRALPARTQITRHDCVEGWSAIGKWTGVPLSALLEKAGLKREARYIVFHCADTMEFAEGGGADDAPDDAADASSNDAASDGNGQQGSSGALAWGGSASSDAGSADKKGDGGQASGGALAWGGGGSGGDKPADPKASDPKAAASRPADPKKTGNPDMQARPAGSENQASDSSSSGADNGGQGGTPIRYYESIDLTDAYHPQTILAYEMNGRPLPVSNGAPLRLRVERQLGYKQAKYIMRIEVVDGLAAFGDGKGGYWEDRGYEWYAGI